MCSALGKLNKGMVRGIARKMGEAAVILTATEELRVTEQCYPPSATATIFIDDLQECLKIGPINYCRFLREGRDGKGHRTLT